ncbi:MAG: hypothetical protein J2P36_22360, partial [Ktedonobacteraceae bacterium]|nr:hypothetical protein [Ktedonobacteraceae bacterium]
MIILWGLPGDDPLTMVHGALLRRGAPVLFIDQRKILQTQVELRVGENNSADVAGYINVHGQRTSLEAISAAYLRPYSVRQLPAIAQADPRSYAWKHASMVSDLLSSWIDLTPARVVNRPEAMATNSSKPYQATWIQSAGFAVPETIMTTDPQKAYAFWQKHKKIIYKSISGVRSIVSRLSEDQRERLEHVRWCPTQFQQYIPGI